MSTAIDSNILAALWDVDDALNLPAQAALEAARGRGELVLSAPVYAELLASRGRNEAFLDSFCRDAGIFVDWVLDEAIWRAAGRAFRVYSIRRRKHVPQGPRRILADFVIGAHALRRGHALLSLDFHPYRAAFPNLHIITA